MNVTKAEYIISAVKPAQYPDDALPEIALAGRSNVGKSSLINCLIRRKNLARTSSKPGKTQTINFYRINDLLYFADVPGYGFARVPKSVQAAWGKMMETYLTRRETLKAVIQVVDVRHPPTADDRNMYLFLKHYQIPVIVVATKADKISKGKWQKHLKGTREGLELQKGDPLLLFSAETAYGKDNLWREIENRIGLEDNQV
ncbi:ribosome biogenesis GTP-binding protein YihA/YsxC [Paenactinomyces guangxiensis]|uniref:Probable GTP-binding protein EngB n=1 Tax=Paenactinomyces guangxiensis TaxID=1490290 RepID=A0A7W1WUW2_9BACL|nr:ribosome biogenesis GTP-binding protein YihA/YsxC [Paenactinomyces guangxiensis]MBA4496286.1 YihA family ribosome biogenesis GTP-binding protein [Paenactinomyces guangxiensis]MBH8593339.1 YihA family ribosome biogenesis GTP-binding protein [Paenactinomyces guangxiensis]